MFDPILNAARKVGGLFSGKKAGDVRKRRELRFESLEKRILLSADLPVDLPDTITAPDMLPDVSDAIVEMDTEITRQTIHAGDSPDITVVLPAVSEEENTAGKENADTPAASKIREVVFVDGQVQDYESLVEEILAAGNDADTTRADSFSGHTNYDVIILDPMADGITQISDHLEEYDDLTAVHVLSHGSSGNLVLGNGNIDDRVLEKRDAEIHSWGMRWPKMATFCCTDAMSAAVRSGLIL